MSSLPPTPRVDFVELEEVSELVGRVAITPGRYTGMTLTVDFADATALLTDQTTPAAIVDGNGDAITGEVENAIEFPVGAQAVVVQLDLDLSQSIEVDLAANRITFVSRALAVQTGIGQEQLHRTVRRGVSGAAAGARSP